MKYILSLILSLVLQIVASQNTNLVFKTEKENFILYINDIQQANTPTTYIRVNNFDQTQARIKISFTDNNSAPLVDSITFNAGGETHYSITNQEGIFKINWEKHLELDATLPIEKDQIEVYYKDPEGKIHTPPVKKVTYEGKTNCEKPMSLGETMGIYNSTHQYHYPDEKYRFLSKSLKNRCISTEHIIKLLALFKNDFYEEKFSIFIYDYTYDLDNFNHVIDTLSENAANNVKSKLDL